MLSEVEIFDNSGLVLYSRRKSLKKNDKARMANNVSWRVNSVQVISLYLKSLVVVKFCRLLALRER